MVKKHLGPDETEVMKDRVRPEDVEPEDDEDEDEDEDEPENDDQEPTGGDEDEDEDEPENDDQEPTVGDEDGVWHDADHEPNKITRVFRRWGVDPQEYFEET